jgi:hypothetical protein
MVSHYQSNPLLVRRISGLLLDRIDIHIEAPPVEYGKLSDERRPGGLGCNRDAAPGGGHPIPTQEAGLAGLP